MVDDINNNHNNDKEVVVDHTINPKIFHSSDPLVGRMDEIIASLVYDEKLSENEVFNICINFSWYFFGRHLESLQTSKDPGIRKNYDALFYQFIYDYIQTIQGQATILQTMIDNNLRTFLEYIQYEKSRQQQEQDNNKEDSGEQN